MEKLCYMSFYSHQNLKAKQEERRLCSKAPQSKRAPKTTYKSFVLYVASANPKLFCFQRITQIDTVMRSERDQPVNQKRKQWFTQPLKFSLCWVFFIHMSKESVLCLYHCTLYRPLPLDTRPPWSILAVDAILPQKTHTNRKTRTLL